MVPKNRILVAYLAWWLAIVNARAAAFECLSPCKCTGIVIDCSERELTNVPEFDTINGANIVNLSNNEIEEIYFDVFNWRGIEQLQFLYLNINSIIYIDEQAFGTFINLEYLDLSNNYLEYLPSRMFENNTRLETLNLAGNFFGKNVPAIMSSSLKSLDISFSKLASFNIENVRDLPNIQYINLQANNFVYLDSNIFAKHKEISLVLSYNIWACNCSTVALYNWAMENDRIQIDNPIKCVTKNHKYIDMFNATKPASQYKESCDIDEDLFGVIPIKELSLVKENFTTATSTTTNSPAEEDNDEYYQKAEVIVIIVIVLIVLVAIALGVVIGFYFAKSAGRRHMRHRRKPKSIILLK